MVLLLAGAGTVKVSFKVDGEAYPWYEYLYLG